MQGKAANVNVGAAQLGTISYSAEPVTEATNIFPGWDSTDKTVTITATKGQSTFEYECDLIVSTNTASEDSGVDGKTAFTDLYVTATVGTGAKIDNAITSSEDGVQIDGTSAVQTIPLATGTIDANGSDLEHNFKYKISFKDKNESQDKQQGATIAATVSCKLTGKGELYYNNENQTGTEKNPFEE